MRASLAHGDKRLGECPASIRAALLDAAAIPNGAFVVVDTTGSAARHPYATVLDRALRIVGGLDQAGAKPGDRVVVALGKTEDFLSVLWACLVGGYLAMPLSGQDVVTTRTRSRYGRFEAIAERLGDPWLVGDDLGWCTSLQCRPLVLSELEMSRSADLASLSDRPDPGLIIPSSGTTQQPNLVHLDGPAVLHRWWPRMPDPTHATAFLSWSPLDHVMGLSLAAPNLPTKVHLSPAYFVATPLAWLDAVERFGISHGTMTTFGLKTIVGALADQASSRSWVLSSLRKLGVGAEAVSPALCTRFIGQLRRFGLRDDVLILGYGLTECGPVAGGTQPFRPHQAGDGVPPVLDKPTPDHSVRIVDLAGVIVPERETGRVEVRGPTMTSGYFGDPDGTAQLFTPDGWLRTGDLGFLDGERLTITGREKETLSFHARKVSCFEVEAAVCAVPGIMAAYVVACLPRPNISCGGEDRVALFLESEKTEARPLPRVAREVRAVIAQQFGAPPAYVIPVIPGDVPRTPSGKVQRRTLADRFQAGAFDRLVVAPDKQRMDTSVVDGHRGIEWSYNLVRTTWKDALGHVEFGDDDDFFVVGGDSLSAIRLVFALETALAAHLPSDYLLANTTVRQMARSLSTAGGSCMAAPVADGEQIQDSAKVENRIRHLIAGWPGERTGARRLTCGFNRCGSKAPVFWCLQNAEEADALGRHLGPDQPLYVLRSAHLVMPYTPENVRALASRYVEELRSVHPEGPILLCGHCQGGYIAVEMARQLFASGRPVQLLTLTDMKFWEAFDRKAYHGPVALFAGTMSRFNPLRRFRHPERGFRKILPAGVRFEALPLQYGFFYNDESLPHLCDRWRKAIAWSVNVIALAAGAYPMDVYQATLEVDAVPVLHAGEKRSIDVRVTNRSGWMWRPGWESGLALANHWIAASGEMVAWHDGNTPLSNAIAPGASARLALDISAPTIPGSYVIEFDLVEEGVTWFADLGGHSTWVTIQVVPATRDTSDQQHNDMEDERNDAQAQLDALLVSTSWRLTKPFRVLVNAWRRLPHLR